ncbi:MAG: hypothetical protein HQK65_17885, partial [Desulfamplus sp.]|nr:hypothetical protein [Desulfamplus sp.]
LLSCLEETSVETLGQNDCTFRLDQVYDYFFNTTTHAFVNKSTTQRWLEIDDMISNTRSLDPDRLKLLKTIGVLNLISGKSGIPASTPIIRLSLLNPFEEQAKEQKRIDDEIKRLIDEKILIFRQYANEYRLWEGSDFDTHKAIQEKKAELHTKPIDEILNITLPLEPLVASRHSYETGTLRRFEMRWISYDRIGHEEKPDCSSNEYDGLILYCFGRQKSIDLSHMETASHKPLMVAYSPSELQILEMILDAAAANDILQNAPELTRDSVARKEARFIADAANTHLKKHLGQTFSPLNPKLMWFSHGENHSIRSHRDLSSYISRQCDSFYRMCPVVNNEMINYNKISSAASQARRELINSMLLKGHEENLGLHGMGPTVALYRSLLKHFDLHQWDNDAKMWRLLPPEPENNFYSVWQKIDLLITRSGKTHIVLSDVFAMLKEPPFCLKDGPIPIIICFYLIVKSDEVAIYQEGVYIPLVDVAEMELLVKRPDLFSVRYFNPVGVSNQVFQIYKKLLNAQTDPMGGRVRNTSMVSVVGPLMQFAAQLPLYTKNTRMISTFAINVRNALLRCNEPFELLFDVLPQALNMAPFDEVTPPDTLRVTEFQEKFSSTILELAEAYSNLLGNLGNTILKAFNAGAANIDDLKEKLVNRVARMRKQCTERELSSVMRAICKPCETDNEWIESIAGCAMKKTVASWRDSDLDGFSAVISNISNRLDRFEALFLEVANDSKSPKNNHTSRSVVSVMLANGVHFQETIEIDKKTQNKLKQHLDTLNCLTKREQKIMMAMIAHSVMGDK